ncbi:hypothetical protein [Paenibacillus sp. KS-LC4]|uniref:hypothetical protein n=1 Tax=Paenibacillus sp. KS-LC4 TaxID=2979727 RepID=UPI0030CC93D6
MQRLEDFLYDFAGIFIPGFLLLFSLRIITFDLFNNNFVERTFNLTGWNTGGGYSSFLQFLDSEKTVMILCVIIMCYITGLVIAATSEKCAKYIESKYMVNITKIVYSENENLLQTVERVLTRKYKINMRNVSPRNKWVTLYRWANVCATSREESSGLNILLTKMILYRSFFLVFLIIATYLFVIVASFGINELLNLSSISSIEKTIAAIVGVICTVVANLFFEFYLTERLRTGNEALLLLAKAHEGDIENE